MPQLLSTTTIFIPVLLLSHSHFLCDMGNQLLHLSSSSPVTTTTTTTRQRTRTVTSFSSSSSSSSSTVVAKNTQNRIKNVIYSNYHRKGSTTLYSYLFLFLFHSTIFIKTIQSHAQQQASVASVAAAASTGTTQQCESKVLEEIPPDPVS